MSSKKNKNRASHGKAAHGQPGSGGAPQKNPARKTASSSAGKSKLPLIIAAAAIGVVVLIVALSGGGGSGGAVKASPEELKYLGRLLPSGYEAPSVSKPTIYTSDVPVSDVAATDAGATLTLPVAELTSKKNVLFEYQNTSGDTLPLLAYVRPSGKVFVGVSFCPPCEGERQTITADGALTCDSCGTKRNLETQVGLSGACKLYPLDEVPVSVEGGNVVIDKAVLDAWTAQPLDRNVG